MTIYIATSTRTRYLVSWTPTETVEARCRAKGMRDGDGTGFWDWIDPDACTVSCIRETFTDAKTAGREALPIDVCGQVRIARERWVQASDDLGNACRERVWEEDAVWHMHGPSPLSEAEPDFIP